MSSGPENYAAAEQALRDAFASNDAMKLRAAEVYASLATTAAWVDGGDRDAWADALASTGPIPPLPDNTDTEPASSDTDTTEASA